MELPLTFYPKRTQAILLLLVSSAFVAAGIFIVVEGDWKGLICAGFFGLCALVGAVQLLPGSAFLKLTSEGLEYASLFRNHRIPWTAITEIGVCHIRASGLVVRKMVGFNFDPAFTVGARALSQSLSGFEGALPDTYGMKAEDLAKLLIAVQRQTQPAAGGNEDSPARISSG